MKNKEMDAVVLLEKAVYDKLTEVIEFETQLCPLNHSAFMTETNKTNHTKLMEEYESLKTEYNNEYYKLPKNQLPYVEFDTLMAEKRLEIKGLIPLYTGDEFNNNIKLCYERVYIHGKSAIKKLVEVEKGHELSAEDNVKNIRTYYLCMGLCEGDYTGEKVKAYLSDYEQKLKSGSQILEDKEEYQLNVKNVKDLLLELARIRLAKSFTQDKKHIMSPEYERTLEKACISIITRCEVLAAVMPKGTVVLTDLYSLRAMMYEDSKSFTDSMSDETYNQK